MCLARNETRKAVLCVQGVLRRNSKNVDACRLMAEILERGRSSRAALLWRSRVVEYNPGSTEDRMALAHPGFDDARLCDCPPMRSKTSPPPIKTLWPFKTSLALSPPQVVASRTLNVTTSKPLG
jgi:hypothetical protein